MQHQQYITKPIKSKSMLTYFGEPNYLCEINIIGMIFEVSGFTTSKKAEAGNYYRII